MERTFFVSVIATLIAVSACHAGTDVMVGAGQWINDHGSYVYCSSIPDSVDLAFGIGAFFKTDGPSAQELEFITQWNNPSWLTLYCAPVLASYQDEQGTQVYWGLSSNVKVELFQRALLYGQALFRHEGLREEDRMHNTFRCGIDFKGHRGVIIGPRVQWCLKSSWKRAWGLGSVFPLGDRIKFFSEVLLRNDHPQQLLILAELRTSF